MAARPISSATVSFGLVSIPVKLYSAAESAAAIRFNQIDKRDGARVKQQLVSSKSGEVVPKDEIVKGYEFAKNQYVLFTKEELKALEVAATYTIDIEEFVPAGSVDRIYFDKAYYLSPDKGGARAYGLLAAALNETGRVAIGRYAARGRQYLVAVRPKENGLMLEQLHYADEIRAFSEVGVEDVEVKQSELDLAKQLVDQLASDSFDPTTYRDEVRAKMLELIERKVEGEDISVVAAEQPEHKIVDIMEALKASLGTERRPAAQSAPAKEKAGKGKASGQSAAKPKSKKKTAKKKRAS